MKTCTYMAICLFLPFVALADDDEKDVVETSPDDVAAKEEAAPDPDFERFKTILDRMPFGRPPAGFDPDRPGGASESPRGSEGATTEAEVEASEIEQQIRSSVRVSVLNVTPAGKVVVGFTDSSVQPAKNYLLEVGEKREQCEWQVVDADPASRQVKLSKGGVEATLMLGGGGGPTEEKKEKPVIMSLTPWICRKVRGAPGDTSRASARDDVGRPRRVRRRIRWCVQRPRGTTDRT